MFLGQRKVGTVQMFVEENRLWAVKGNETQLSEIMFKTLIKINVK